MGTPPQSDLVAIGLEEGGIADQAGAGDVLVIDEAEQMSLANTLAVCQASGSLVLLGDPRQLDQPILSAGHTNASAEEAECVAGLIRELLAAGTAWVDIHGVQRRLTLDDVLVVAPYNPHVAVLRATLPTGGRVGTVDKFQGQEAPIVIYSMATSTSTSPPRAPAASPRSSPVPFSSRRTAAPRSGCAWPTPSAASPSWLGPLQDTRPEVDTSPVMPTSA